MRIGTPLTPCYWGRWYILISLKSHLQASWGQPTLATISRTKVDSYSSDNTPFHVSQRVPFPKWRVRQISDRGFGVMLWTPELNWTPSVLEWEPDDADEVTDGVRERIASLTNAASDGLVVEGLRQLSYKCHREYTCVRLRALSTAKANSNHAFR